MKGSIKKLAVFVIIPAIAMFILTGMASAHPPFPRAIRGQYAFMGTNTCMLAPLGFNPDLTPIQKLAVISNEYRQGIYTFEKNGTGSSTLQASVIVIPYGPTLPSASTKTIEYDFTYTVADDGMITITPVPGTYFSTNTSGPSNGVTYQVEGSSFKATITPDGKNITTFVNASDLFTVVGPGLPPYSPNISCGGAGVMIWQNN